MADEQGACRLGQLIQRACPGMQIDFALFMQTAQEIVKAAITAPDRRAEQLTSGIAWLWSVYTAVTLVVLTTRSQSLPVGATALLAMPAILLIVAYWFASRVRNPYLVRFDPRIPREIADAHRDAVAWKNRALAVAEAITGIAASCVVIATVGAFVAPTPVKAELHGYILRSSNKLLLAGAFPQHAAVRLLVRTTGMNPAPREVSLLQLVSATGELHAELDVPQAQSYRVSASWDEDKTERSISFSVERAD